MAAPALQPAMKFPQSYCPPARRRSRKAVRRARTLSLLLVLLVAALVLVLFPRVVHTQAHSEMTGSSYTVVAGDTLWEIAARNAGRKDVREVIYLIEKANNLSSTAIQPGQVLFIPDLPGEGGKGR